MEIEKLYESIKEEIDKKIDEYKEAFNYDNKDFFAEIAFCILTPQSKALNAWKIIQTLKENDLLFTADSDTLENYLNSIRFKKTKAKRLVSLREKLSINGSLEAKKIIFNGNDVFKIREWLVKNIDGFGYKEASHVLRNLGFGENIAILDRHILRNLLKLEIIDEIPKTLTPKKYMDIEEKMRKYSSKIDISMDRLDLLFWYNEVNYLFK
ncbi:N-glycosylase/DNA lyase [Sneathia sp. DSM 16631]|uniref:N-glycosylase/DNA lyase n=1 Tax=Sneathia sp. DSM 16631 TaxID=2777994 RepID=UPI00186931B5|nr:N-glycosylase/DNA lyase [Sneathia sp. DSM 16631]MBE3030408.1 N-glycosylase/DNA lyase [Sneathia sp. DSM 16631]